MDTARYEAVKLFTTAINMKFVRGPATADLWRAFAANKEAKNREIDKDVDDYLEDAHKAIELEPKHALARPSSVIVKRSMLQ